MLSWTEDPAATRTFTWQDSAGVSRAWLRWGRTPLSEAGRTEAAVVASGAGRVRFEATARGLSPGSEYYYSLGAEETGWSAPVSFTTAPALPDSFSFLFLGDINPAAVSEYDDWGLLLAEAAERSPDLAFALLGGDMVESGRPEEWDGFLTNAAPVFSRLPLLSVNGNHESNYIGGKPLEYLNIFALPRNGPPGFEEEFYSFDYGPAHIIVLNSHVYSGEQNLSEAELTALSEWIRQDLAASPAVWKIAAFHHPAYALARDTVSDGVRANWAPLLEAGGVQLALVGHQHVYSRSRPLTDGAADYENGVVYIMGNSGLKFYTTADESFSERIVYGAANYQVVSLSAEALTATTFAAGGAELDAVTLAARGPSGPGRADVSGDGRADFQDMWLVEEAILAGQAAAELDVNGDGTVDILDAQAAYLGGSGS
ncbi:MAG: metallophosphoesterase [Gracilibacteraceae bacterium]|nr:metallophosphoesterase [Gracilibacteraceae bacterium]